MFFKGAPYKPAVPHSDGMVIAYADGHAKWMNAKTFLSKCPTKADYDAGTPPKSVSAMGYTGNFAEGQAPKIYSDWPFWGLYKNQ